MTNTREGHAEDKDYLAGIPQFQKLPAHVQSWVITSPLASAQFAQFFREGGIIVPDPNQPFAVYYEHDAATKSPSIHINPSFYPLVNFEKKNTSFQESELFAVMAHEIGHHSINSRAHPFTGTTAEENIRYRSEHEAMAILNAFKIIDELKERDPSYQPNYGGLGYGSELSIGAIYSAWRRDHDQAAVIKEIASVVLGAEDSRTKKGQDNVPDYNNDGKHTHAERYRRDWEESEERRQNSPMQREPISQQSAGQGHADTLAEPSARPVLDPRDPSHPDHAMHESVRTKLCDLYAEQELSIDGDRLDRLTAGVMADARRSNMTRVDLLEFSEDYATGKPDTNGNIIAFQGDPMNPASPYSGTAIDQAIKTPVEDNYRQLETATKQHAEQWDRFITQEQELSQSRGMHYSR